MASMSIATFNKTIPLSFNIVMFKVSKTASFLDIKPLNLCEIFISFKLFNFSKSKELDLPFGFQIN
jgi:hypothetical protein